MKNDRMRFLLISDTHGHISVVNHLAELTQCNVVIHAGDFGFYDDGSYDRLSDRELRLMVAHSNLPEPEKNRILSFGNTALAAEVREHRLAGDFQSYLYGEKSLCVPVYSVWGNHEDRDVVERMYNGDIHVKNLHLLHNRQYFKIGQILIYGLGGNFLPGSKMLQKPIAGGSGKVWSTLSQYADLVGLIDDVAEEDLLRLFVSHVSPGKEAFLEFIGARTRVNFTVSGHMGAPHCMVWNSFTINTVEESVRRLNNCIESTRKALLNSAGSNTKLVDDVLSRIGRLPDEVISMGRGVTAPRYYRDMHHINLPDAHVGYAVLDIADGCARVQTCTYGVPILD